MRGLWRLAASTLIGVAACRSGGPQAAGAPGVVASIPPLAAIAAEVHVDPGAVSSFLPPGANPHAFEPRPGDVARARDAQLLLVIGLGFDDWALRAARAAAARPPRVLVASEGLELLPLAGEEAAAHPGESADPHLWLDPRLGGLIGERVAEALAELDPPHAADYRARAAALQRRLEALDAELGARLAPVRGAGFVATHAAWGYLARRYGLVEGAVLEAAPGREPGPRHLLEASRLARERGLRAVFAEVQLSDASARVVAEEAGIPVVHLDALGGPGVPGRARYEDLLRWNVERIAAALEGHPVPGS